MILLSPRITRLAVLTLAFLTLISLPTFRSDRSAGSALTPRIACAGGSPDETLKPHDDMSRTASVTSTVTATRTADTHRPYTKLTAHQRWQLIISVLRTLAIRF